MPKARCQKQHNMTKISVNEVTKKYADHTALDRMCIDIPEQCIYGLLGPNGAGKTTLIRTPASAIRQTARGAKGVRVVDVADGDAVVSATVVPASEEDPGDDPAEDAPSDTPDAPAPAETSVPAPTPRPKLPDLPPRFSRNVRYSRNSPPSNSPPA